MFARGSGGVALVTALAVALGCDDGNGSTDPGGNGSPASGGQDATGSGGQDASGSGGQDALGSGGSAPAGAGGQGGEPGPPPAHAPADCNELASTACQALQSCAPFYLQRDYRNEESCRQVLASACEHFESEGRPIDGSACATVLRDGGCQAVASRGIPIECRLPRGSLQLGEECGIGADCESLYCQEQGAPCGICAQASGPGGECNGPYDCVAGLMCTTQGCDEPVEDGEPCDVLSDYRCGANSYCSTAGACTPQGLEGDSCSGGIFPECARVLGYTCNGAVCVAIDVLDEGDDCSGGGNAVCVGDMYCSGTFLSRTCVPAASAGEACSPELGCRPPLYCVDGVCSFEPEGGCVQ